MIEPSSLLSSLPLQISIRSTEIDRDWSDILTVLETGVFRNATSLDDELVKKINNLLKYYVEQKDWRSLEKFILDCLQKPLDPECYSLLRINFIQQLDSLIPFSEIKQYHSLCEEYYKPHVRTKKGAQAVIDFYVQKGSFRNIQTRENLPVYILEASIDDEAIVEDAELQMLTTTLTKNTRYECGLMVNIEYDDDEYHWSPVFVSKEQTRLALYNFDSKGISTINDRLFQSLEKAFKKAIDQLEISYRYLNDSRQNDSDSCFIFSIKDLSAFARFPEIRQSIDGHPTETGTFEPSPKMMRLTQSLKTLVNYETTLDERSILQLNLPTLITKHFEMKPYKNRLSSQNQKAWHHMKKYEIIIWKSFFNYLSDKQ